MSVITDAADSLGGGATRSESNTSSGAATASSSDRSDSDSPSTSGSTDPFANNFDSPNIDMKTINMTANTLVALVTLREVVGWS